MWYQAPVTAEMEEETSRHQTKHQAVFSLDMATWRDIIKTLDIKEPMIPHRREEAQGGPGARGWYS